MEPLRVACPADGEAQPLAWGLDLPPWDRSFRLERDADPLLTAARLATGELDAAVLPAHLAAAQADRLELIPGLAVASRGACGCGLLLHRRPLEQLRTAIDLAPGHAAGALCAILFAAGGSPLQVRAPSPGEAPAGDAEAYVGGATASWDLPHGEDPEGTERGTRGSRRASPNSGGTHDSGAAAGAGGSGRPEPGRLGPGGPRRTRLGRREPTAEPTPAPPAAAGGRPWRRLDLGRAWSELTGLPFVWWVWAARPGVLRPEIYRRLHTSRTRGRREHATRAGAPAASGLRYRLGNAELAGLRRFWAEGRERGIFPAPSKPRLYSPRPGLADPYR